MNRNLAVLATVAALLVLTPTVQAASGYYESFNDANDVNGASPVAEPTAWYTFTGVSGSPYLVQSGQMCCGNSGGSGLFTWAVPVLSGSFALSVDYTLTIPTTGATGSIQFADINAASSGQVLENSGTAACTGHTADLCAAVFNGCGTTQGGVISRPSVASGHFTYSYDATTNTVTTTDSRAGGTCITTEAPKSTSRGFSVTSNNGPNSFDNLVWNDFSGATYTAPTAPRPPAGLSAFVKQAWTSTQSQFELRWPLSPDDPEPILGTLGYSIYANGVLLGVDQISALDGGGSRYHLVVFTSGAPNGLTTFWIVADDRGVAGLPSCQVSVDDRTAGQTQVCGNINGLGLAENATSAGNALLTFAQGIGFSTPSDLFLFGLLLVLIVAIIIFAIIVAFGKGKTGNVGKDGLVAASVPSSISAVGMMVFVGLVGFWPSWTAILLIAITSAIITTFILKIYGFGGK